MVRGQITHVFAFSRSVEYIAGQKWFWSCSLIGKEKNRLFKNSQRVGLIRPSSTERVKAVAELGVILYIHLFIVNFLLAIKLTIFKLN